MKSADVTAIVINGPSSSGKTATARRLQQILPEMWWHVSSDSIAEAVTPSVTRLVKQGGNSALAEAQRLVELVFDCTAMVVTRLIAERQFVIVDTVMQAGLKDSTRWHDALNRNSTLWVGLDTPVIELRRREAERVDRLKGMAEQQMRTVHDGIDYDLRIETGAIDVDGAAMLIADTVRRVTTHG